MKTTAFITNLFTFASIASATNTGSPSGMADATHCWDFGETQTNWIASLIINKACYRGFDGKIGYLQGMYDPGQSKFDCYDTVGKVRYELSVVNPTMNEASAKINDPQHLDENLCVQRFNELINECKHGGVKVASPWQFIFDPNAGVCA